MGDIGSLGQQTGSCPIILSSFPTLKSALSGRRFRSSEEVQQAMKNFLRSLGADFYQDGFLKLIPRPIPKTVFVLYNAQLDKQQYWNTRKEVK
ncbi:hypothetical protein AVEN_260799-1 [Araneus ventricosus]|uniref:Uncharacterized protein n=1 Tax=Araneus ventricosus TaxID=182803 RepID=A0A4Y2FDN5_ARAVE|nr:hypothetical protein AVEN_260799-1 [Araneus ventricosus]